MSKREVKLAQSTFSYLRSYLSRNDRILDVGTGHGFVAELISKNVGAQVVGIDVIDINRTGIKTHIFNGQDIPFEENVFTVTLCAFVLHHANNPQRLLEEMRRVTQSTIIVFEDVRKTPLDTMLGFLHKLTSIFRYHSPRVHLKSDDEWRNMFRETGLALREVRSLKRTRDLPYYPISRRMYVLKKQPSNIT